MNRQILHRTRLLLPPVLVTLVALLAPTLSVDATAPQRQAAAPVYGGTLRVAFSDDYLFLDPAEATGSDEGIMYYTMFDGLYKSDQNNQPQLDLAAAPPTVSADGKTWTVTLRKGVDFSNGMPVTADDVKYSIMRTLDPHLVPVSYCQSTNDIYVGSHAFVTGKATDVPGIQVLDPYTLRMQLTQPNALLPYILASECNFVVPKAIVSKETEQQFSDQPIGTGPFILQSYQKAVQAVFVRNPHYFQPGKPYLDKIITYLNVSPSVIALRIRHGDLDAYADPDQVDNADIELFGGDATLRPYLRDFDPVVSLWLDINASDPLMQSPLLRQAIAMAIDRRRLVQLDGGLATPAYQLYMPQFPQYDPALATNAVYPYDPQKAAALVKASGYKGQSLVYIDRAGTAYFQNIAPGIQQQLQQIGLNVTVKTLAHTAYHVTRLQITGHEMDAFDWGINYYDGYDLYSYMLLCSANGNGGFSGAHYCDPTADTLANKAETLPLGAARTGLLRQAQLRILKSATRVPLLFTKRIGIVSPRIGGLPSHPIFNLVFPDIWLTK
jgi:ABC-type transport system substrate-binding protein